MKGTEMQLDFYLVVQLLWNYAFYIIHFLSSFSYQIYLSMPCGGLRYLWSNNQNQNGNKEVLCLVLEAAPYIRVQLVFTS
jgi:nicotinamide riboside transporter PnuC